MQDFFRNSSTAKIISTVLAAVKDVFVDSIVHSTEISRSCWSCICPTIFPNSDINHPMPMSTPQFLHKGRISLIFMLHSKKVMTWCRSLIFVINGIPIPCHFGASKTYSEQRGRIDDSQIVHGFWKPALDGPGRGSVGTVFQFSRENTEKM